MNPWGCLKKLLRLGRRIDAQRSKVLLHAKHSNTVPYFSWNDTKAQNNCSTGNTNRSIMPSIEQYVAMLLCIHPFPFARLVFFNSAEDRGFAWMPCMEKGTCGYWAFLHFDDTITTWTWLIKFSSFCYFFHKGRSSSIYFQYSILFLIN